MSEGQENYGHEDDQEPDDGMPQTFMHEIAMDAWRYNRGNWQRLQVPSVTLEVSFEEEEDSDAHDHCEIAIEALGYIRIAGNEPNDAVGSIQIYEKTDPKDDDLITEPFAVSITLDETGRVVFCADFSSLVGLIRELKPIAKLGLQRAVWCNE